jgi:mono/diheme cytochrome c family protein
MKRLIVTVFIAIGALVAVAAAVIFGGVYNVAADEEHSALVYRVLETGRERSIAVRLADVPVPDLNDPQRIRRGAGNYDSMCAGCHLSPDAAATELSRGLYPRPPNLTRSADQNPARAFWIIKHGIKATGMPAWGKSMEDNYIWDMVALLKQLPRMSAEQYAAEVGASGGHSHGGGEMMNQGGEHDGEHEHAEGEVGHSHDAAASKPEGHAHDATDESESAGVADAEADQDGGRADGPLAVVNAFHTAIASGRAALVERLLDPKVLIMEGGNVERSRQEYASHHLIADLKFMSSVTYTLARQSGDTVGDLAWVASESRLIGQSEPKPVELVSTESLVLRKMPAGWKIVHIHWSSRSAKKP